jgi:hypothetical protein
MLLAIFDTGVKAMEMQRMQGRPHSIAIPSRSSNPKMNVIEVESDVLSKNFTSG